MALVTKCLSEKMTENEIRRRLTKAGFNGEFCGIHNDGIRIWAYVIHPILGTLQVAKKYK
jgi:hypothetical protein